MVSHLVPRLGYGWAMRTCAFVILALLAIANLTVRTYRAPTPRRVTARQLFKPLTEAGFLLLTLCFLLFPFGYFGPLNYIPTEALAAGMSEHLAQYLVPILNASSLFGRLSSGFLGDKLGLFNAFVASSLLTAVWILALWLPGKGDAATIAFTILFGFSTAPFAALATPLVMQISPLNETGYRTGMLFLAAALSGLVTNPLCGAILDTPSGWVGFKIFCGVMCFAGGAFVTAARLKVTNWKILTRF